MSAAVSRSATFRMIAAAACVTLSGCVSAPPSLDDLIGFSDPRHCEPDAAFSAILDGLVELQAVDNGYIPVLKAPPVPTRFRDRVGRPELKVNGDEYRAVLPLRGAWRGLPLRSVAVVGWIESEQGFILTFEADRAQVLAEANQAGFGIPASGSEYREGVVMGVNVGVGEHDGDATLYCIPG